MDTIGWSIFEAFSISNSTYNGWYPAVPSILAFVAGLGGWSVIVVGISVYIGSLLTDKMKIIWMGETNEKLEKLRAEINQDHSLFKSVLDSYSKEFQFTQSDRIEAIKLLWEKILLLRELGKAPLLFYEILLETEFNSIYSNKKFMDDLVLIMGTDTIEKINNYRNEVEKHRPFLGEYLWTLFRTYSILIGRVAYLLDKGVKERNIHCWHKDKYLRSILDVVLSEDEKRYIFSLKIGSFKAATEILERKIIYEITKIVYGELAANNNYEKAVQIQQLLRNETKNEVTVT